jgi:alpha-1,6-mannosyltransferase
LTRVRVVDVCGFYSPDGGGIRTYVEQKLRLAELLGQDITILAPGAADATTDISPSARIMTIASPRFPLDRKYFSFTNQQAVHRALDFLQPDFVEASSPWNSANYVAAWPRAIPRSLVMHSEPLSAHAYRWFERIVEPPAVDRAFDWFWQRLRGYGRMFDAVIVANSSLAQRLSAGGVGNVITVPMGVQPGVFSPARRDEALRRRLLAMCALGPEATLLLCAGRLATEKRVPMLVEAATIAGRRRPIGMVIFGQGRSHKEVLRAIGGNPHVRLLQPVRERAQFATILASADALLHGCEAETFGMIAAEAHASGIPLVAPEMGGAGDFVRGTPLGFRPADTSDVVRAILELPAGPREAMAPRTPRSMEEHFRDLYRLYAELASNANAAAA